MTNFHGARKPARQGAESSVTMDPLVSSAVVCVWVEILIAVLLGQFVDGEGEVMEW